MVGLWGFGGGNGLIKCVSEWASVSRNCPPPLAQNDTQATQTTTLTCLRAVSGRPDVQRVDVQHVRERQQLLPQDVQVQPCR